MLYLAGLVSEFWLSKLYLALSWLKSYYYLIPESNVSLCFYGSICCESFKLFWLPKWLGAYELLVSCGNREGTDCLLWDVLVLVSVEARG